MSRLTKFVAQPIDLKLGDEVFKIYPLTMKNIPLLMSAASTNVKEQGEAFKKMMEITLKKAVPDATAEEIEGFSMNYFKELSEAIIFANGLKEDVKNKLTNTEIKREE